MKNYRLGDMELEFANLIWEHEPISSGELVQLCDQKFSWKKSTTYTMLKRLCNKGIFQNNSGSVTSLLTKQEWFTKQILLMFVKNFFLEVAQKKGRTKRTHQIAGFEKMM